MGHVDVVEGITDAGNAPSIRLLHRVGMRLVRAQQTRFKGGMCIESVYAVSRAQWREAAADGYQ